MTGPPCGARLLYGASKRMRENTRTPLETLGWRVAQFAATHKNKLNHRKAGLCDTKSRLAFLVF
jgi:hypothetical protein